VVQLNQFCAGANQARDPVTGACSAGGPYALGNLANMIDDYEITHGMIRGRDYEMVVVVHSGGGFIVVKDQALRAHGKPGNPYEGQVRALMNKGVKFAFCQNTTRAYLGNGTLTPGNATAEIIEGVTYTTAGLTSIADYQARGYQYIQP
jgi:intracellular sulfur oxidation DsrE/DsrF family protein